MVLFSLIVPTRGRPDRFRRLLESLRETAGDLDTIEVVAVMDADDTETRALVYTGVRLERVVVPPGESMGSLNLAGYAAARGRYLMLLNDDVVARTPGWDKQLAKVLEYYPDGIVLAHVNDLVFHDTLCTFPLVRREFCELAGGICRSEYRRYRIDDHLHHIFDLVHLLGYTRRIYLPEIIFEHLNAATDSSGTARYVPDEDLVKLDNATFEALIEERRRVALACIGRIEGPASELQTGTRQQLLAAFPDSLALRRREYAQWWDPVRAKPMDSQLADVPNPAATSYHPRFAARVVFRMLGILAEAAARLPAIARLGLGIPPSLFDSAWYQAHYPEVGRQDSNPLLHYLRKGGFAGYKPNPHFDSQWYLAMNPHVAASGMNPLVHFVHFGAREGRSPNLLFDLQYYFFQNPDIGNSRNPLEHFLTVGMQRGCSPLASASLPEYLRRVASPQRPARVEVNAPAPLSVVIPTRNRRETLGRMLSACRRHSADCNLEFVVMDDGSTDETAAFLREKAGSIENLRWQSLPPGGPGRARNLAATLARHPILLFLGDDILPANDDFFRVHAWRHAERPENDYAVLGKIDWPATNTFPVNFVMRHIHDEGSQFAFCRLAPESFVTWRFFYSSNLSVKKLLIQDWATAGFDAGFPGAALEDMELAYRLWQSPQGIRIYYDPGSTGLHYHAYDVGSFLDRQYFAGRSLRRMLELHPELVDEYGVRHIQAALYRPHRKQDSQDLAKIAAAIETIKTRAFILEKQNLLGSDDWHGNFLSALFELGWHDGYVSSWPAQEVNVAAARKAIVDRLRSRVRQIRL